MRKYFFLFLVLSLLAFGRLLAAPFVYDDILTLRDNGLLHSFSNIPKLWKGYVDTKGEMEGIYRPLFLSGLTLFGTISHSPWFFRFVTLLLHSCNALGVFWIGSRIFKLKDTGALLASLLFLLHPLQVTSLDLVWKQNDLWVAFAALFSILSFEKWARTKNTSWGHVAFGLFTCALFIKESALVIPLFWLVIEPFFDPALRKRRLTLIGMCFVMSVLFYLTREYLARFPLDNGGVFASRWQYFFSQIRVFGLYAQAMIVPDRLTIDRNISLALEPSLFQKDLVIAIGLAIALLLAKGLLQKKRPALAVSMAFIWLLPTSSFQPLALLYDETRLYLLLPPLIWMISPLLERIRIPLSNSTKNVALILGLLILVVSAHGATFRFASEEALWMAAVDVDPRSARAYYQLGFLKDQEKDWDQAQVYYKEALSHSRGMPQARLNLGILYGKMGDLERAGSEFERLLTKDKYWAALGHYHLELNDLYRGRVTEAKLHLLELQKLMPGSPLVVKGQKLLMERDR